MPGGPSPSYQDLICMNRTRLLTAAVLSLTLVYVARSSEPDPQTLDGVGLAVNPAAGTLVWVLAGKIVVGNVVWIMLGRLRRAGQVTRRSECY